MVFQSYALFPTMTVYENLAFGLKVKKMSASDIDRKVREVAKTIAIKDDQLVRNVSELSGGQQQRVALARAIVLEAEDPLPGRAAVQPGREAENQSER